MTKKILIADDEQNIVISLEFLMKREGFAVCVATDGQEAIDKVRSETPDLVLLDIMMPRKNGYEVCQEIRSDPQLQGTRILMLTAKGREMEVTKGLAMGADAYMTKPFSTRELVSRIKAVLRRANALSGEKTIDANGLILDPVSQRVSFGDNILEMGPTEYRLLAFFMTHPERAYTRAQLLDQVWGGNVYIEDRTIDVHIRRLRKVLEPYGVDRFVQTVRGTGYRFSTRADVALG